MKNVVQCIMDHGVIGRAFTQSITFASMVRNDTNTYNKYIRIIDISKPVLMGQQISAYPHIKFIHKFKITLVLIKKTYYKSDGELCYLARSFVHCDKKLPSQSVLIVFSENETGTNRFIHIKTLNTWHEARSYCRQNYTDLAIIRSQSENDQLKQINKYQSSWISLYRDSWMWSDKTNVSTSITWKTRHPT